MRILSVDDETSFTEMIRLYFEPRGYYIDVTSDGEEALRLLMEKKYDVVLLDLKMANLSGEDILKEIKKNSLPVRIIFITAYNDSGKTRERLLGGGAYAVIEKPISSLKNLEKLVCGAMNVDCWKEI